MESDQNYHPMRFATISGLQLIKFDFVTGGQEIKLAFLVEFLLFSVTVILYLKLITFGDLFFQFQDNKTSLKQALGHNYKNTMY